MREGDLPQPDDRALVTAQIRWALQYLCLPARDVGTRLLARIAERDCLLDLIPEAARGGMPGIASTLSDRDERRRVYGRSAGWREDKSEPTSAVF